MVEKYSESKLEKIWRYQLLDKDKLATEDGEPVKVIYPGRLNNERGADFRDAVIIIGRRMFKGDVEIHVKSGDWRSHHHHLDRAYNSVILHVVMWHSSRTPTMLQNGKEVPVLTLAGCMNTPADWSYDTESFPLETGVPCSGSVHRRGIPVVMEFLDRAGEERFISKTERFQGDIDTMGTGQSLYRGIMGALGYSGNKLAFLELARRAPLRVLETENRANLPEGRYLAIRQALLLGTAGFLYGHLRNKYMVNWVDERWIEGLERIWSSSARIQVIPPDMWHLFKIRPGNTPASRIMAMSYLLLRYREEGLLGGLLSLVEGLPEEQGYRGLERGLLVTDYDCGECYHGYPGGLKRRALLGRERAADIVVNVLLPFAFALSRVTGNPVLGEKALYLYRSYPRLGVNSVERHMTEQLGLARGLVNSAMRQQGLIHIYNNLCTQGKCRFCELGELEAGSYVQSQTIHAAGSEPEVAAGGNHGGVIRA